VDNQGIERRINPRVSAVFDIQGTPEEGGVVARMQGADLSLGGLRCTSMTDYPEMTQLAVRLMLPKDGNGQSEPVDIKAVVVRSNEIDPATQSKSRFELALFFTGLEADAKDRIARFIDR
jgi:c-di-GMP-binding flagellar brake protein YcgR